MFAQECVTSFNLFVPPSPPSYSDRDDEDFFLLPRNDGDRLFSSSPTTTHFRPSPDEIWMSAQPLHPLQDSTHWQPANPVRSYNQQTPQQYSAHPDYYSYNHQQVGANSSRDWQPVYSDAFSPYAINQTSPQLSKLRQHRRALSNSTITSQASTSSPHQPTPLYHNGAIDLNQPRPFQHHYYPTPTHTPTQDSSSMDRGYNRRNGAQQNTSAAAHAGQVSATNFPSQLRTSAQYSLPYNNSTEYPATPNTANGDYPERRYNAPQYGEIRLPSYGLSSSNSYVAATASQHPIPRLEPSLTEACANELYNPSVGAPSAQYDHQPQQMNQNLLLPSGLQERIHAAHEARSKSPIGNGMKRDTSPYVEGSVENPTYGAITGDGLRTVARQRQEQKWEDDRYQQWRHQTRGHDTQQEPKTISPKDAYVDDFRDPAEDSAIAGAPLFPTGSNSSQQLFDDGNAYRGGFDSVNGGARFPSTTFTFQPPPIPAIANLPSGNDFKLAPLPHTGSSSDDTPAHLISMETSRSEAESSQDTSLPPPRPQHRPTAPRPSNSISTADTGTYSCTYLGCVQRFATPALLQKHKRDFHRPAGSHPAATSRPTTQSPRPGQALRDENSGSASPVTPVNRNSQAGPHRCDRINPSTGKPCNTVFSRPYDLTRHEDTIHARRPKVICQYCAERGEEKTFSRGDALTRHLRVVHPEVEVFGKGGRRRGL